MSVQVGSFCYADGAAAAAAACAAHVPATSIAASSVVTLSCSGVSESGNLLMRTSIAPADASASAVAYTVETSPAFAPCTHGDVWQAGVTVVLAVVATIVLPWMTYRSITGMLRWGRGDPA